MNPSKTVLVTGASGFIATHCILKLASEGYKIRGTVRDFSRVDSLEKLLSAGLKKYYQGSNLDVSWLQADLNADNGWADAAKDCDFVLHVASPVTFSIHGEDVDLLHLPLGNNVVVIYVRRICDSSTHGNKSRKL